MIGEPYTGKPYVRFDEGEQETGPFRYRACSLLYAEPPGRRKFGSIVDKPAGDITPRAVQACHELLAWLIPLLDHFPRARRFTLGERLESSLLAMLEDLVRAAYTPISGQCGDALTDP